MKTFLPTPNPTLISPKPVTTIIPSVTVNLVSGSSLVSVYYGKKRYELSDWLGNVRVVVSDKKVPDNTSGAVVLNYKPEVLSIRDYYAFGSEINERTFEPIKPKYRYGFNNKENDNEIYGNGNAINFGDRIYNSRLGVWWGVDAKYYKYPMISPYVFAGDNPIIFVDRDGRDIRPVTPSAIKEFENFYKNPTSNDVINKFFQKNVKAVTYTYTEYDKYGNEKNTINIQTYQIDVLLWGKLNKLIDSQKLSEEEAQIARGLFIGLSSMNDIYEIGAYSINDLPTGSINANHNDVIKQITTNDELDEFVNSFRGIYNSEKFTSEEKNKQINNLINQFTENDGSGIVFKKHDGKKMDFKGENNSKKNVLGQFVYKAGDTEALKNIFKELYRDYKERSSNGKQNQGQNKKQK